MYKNKKHIKVNIDTPDNSEKDILDETLDNLEKGDNKALGENILNFLNILKESETKNKTYFVNKNYTANNPFYGFKNPLMTTIPPLQPLNPPCIPKEKPNENLLEDLKLLDKKLDEILNFVTKTNIGTDLVDENIKNYINLLRDQIDYKASYLQDEISFKFGKKSMNKFFLNDSFHYRQEYDDADQNCDKEILEYDYKKKIFI